jgi:FAD/FMN-containing dehydrogenase/Fe-S oxidoreductase
MRADSHDAAKAKTDLTAARAESAGLASVLQELRSESSCQIRNDRLARAIYATDASIYEICPDVVVFPRCAADVQAVVRACARCAVAVTPRGAGTGLTGGCVNRGVVLDLSRHLNRVLEIDPQARTARVEPGVVLDELNAQLKPHGLHFSPDVATASRATIGGMIGNNSAGAHSILVGRTCDHVLGLEAVLSDGSLARWGAGTQGSASLADSASELADKCEQALAAVAAEYADEIAARFPKVFRRNGGYALDRLRTAHGRTNVEQVIVGSEGTLCITVAATLKLLPLPKHKGLLVIHYADLLAALRSVPAVLAHQPAAIELLDKLILDGTKVNPAMRPRRWFLDGDPAAILIVEFYDEDAAGLQRRLADLAADMQSRGIGYARRTITEPAQQADVWHVRKAATGLLLSRPGDMQPHDFIDDCAVEPARLADYITRLNEILTEEGVERAGYYGHTSVGLLHVRPALNLKTREGVQRLRRIADRVSRLVQEFEGAMTGEHGEGLVRSEWIERMFGPNLVEAFRKVKTTFDPHGIFNPGKIIDPLPMDSNLRYGAGFTSHQPATMLDFSKHGGMAGLAEMCSGVGDCRKRLVGTLCPSYMATGEETHTTRARANALRLALSNRDLLDGLADPALDEVFDLCLSCKACKTECPTGTDVAKLKTEWLHHRNQRLGVPRRSRLIARSVDLAIWGSRFAPLSNPLLGSKAARVMMEHWYGLDRRVPPPPFARQTFRAWFARRRPHAAADLQAGRLTRVVYFADTWTNCYTPQVGIAAVKVLEALGCQVLVPPTVCCARPLISKGLLDEAARLAHRNVEVLGQFAERGLPILGTEPSCVSALTDELPQLVRTDAARRIAALVQPLEQFVAAKLRETPELLNPDSSRSPLLFHGHCHQKALTGTADVMRLLALCTPGGDAQEINSGCCGMAGSFGHEVEHYEVARAIGEQRLFPAIRARGQAQIAVAGFSCRHHIAHHTGVAARHWVEYVAEALNR